MFTKKRKSQYKSRGVTPLLSLLVLAILISGIGIAVNQTGKKQNLLTQAQTAATLTVNGSQQFQVIDGFGVNANSEAWNNGELAPAIDILIDTIGVKTWRVIVESTENWEIVNDNADPNVYNWTYYNSLYQTQKFTDLWGLLGYLNLKNAPHITLDVMGIAPGWMGGGSLTQAREDEYVEMVTSALFYAANTRGLRIDSVNFSNETDIGNPEGVSMGSTQYARVARKMALKLDAIGLNTIKLVAPDTAGIDTGYMTPMLADTLVMSKMHAFGYHNYSGSSGNVYSIIKNSAYPNTRFWMTEFSSWCGGCDNGAPNPNNWDFASVTADYALHHVVEGGASSVQVYDAYDSYYEHHGSMGFWGLLAFNTANRTYTPRKRAYALAPMYKFAEPGSVRIGATENNGSVDLVAFYHQASGKVAITGHNHGGAYTIVGNLTNLPAISSFEYYQTNSLVNMAKGANVAVANNRFTVSVPSDTFFVLTGTSGAATPTPNATVGATATPLPTASATPLPTATPTVRPTNTPTPIPTATPTPRPTNTPTPLPTATPTTRPTNTPTPVAQATNTPTPVPTAPPQTTWTGTYFRNRFLSGTAIFTRAEGTALNRNWGWGSLGGGAGRNVFSARYTKTEDFVGGTYQFSTRHDDGLRIFVDGQQIYSQWRDQSATNRIFTASISQGTHTITAEYYENRGRAQVAVSYIRQ